MMITDKINVRLIDASHEVVTVEWPIKDIEYVEELVYAILENRGVGPVYRLLFGLRLTAHPSLWLAPNIKLQELLNLDDKLLKRSTLDLRMRFRPSSYTKMRVLDKKAFNFIFAQLRYDFIHTKFTDEKRDFILLNNSVLGLIATDLLRYAIEEDINIDEIFKRVDANDFIPEKASKWQRPLLFHLRQNLNLQKSIQVMGFKTIAGEAESNKAFITQDDKTITDEAEAKAKAREVQLLQVKQGFIELFLFDVCKDYGVETYEVICLENPNNQQPLQLRLKYNQTKQESTCIVESRLVSTCSSKNTNPWTELCDIYSICYGTLREKSIEINRSNGRPYRVEFKTSWHAKSFLSLIDGYYRLMKKWHFNFCRDVSSPFLDQLRKIRCHGPIGYETMRMKLSRLKKPGSFLIRNCMENINRYMIDAILPGSRLTIDIEWNPLKKVFTKVDYSASDNIGMIIMLSQEEYPDLKALINDLQIKLVTDQSNSPPLQLKNWIPPSEYDDCPALLLSISKMKLKDFDLTHENAIKSLAELPKFIPQEMLQIKTKLPQRSKNKMFVRLAILNDEKEVIVKDYINTAQSRSSKLETTNCNDLVINLCYKSFESNKFCQQLSPAQMRLGDWIFIKNPMFAETVGLDLKKNSLIQEYFPLGQLDKFLLKSKDVSESTRCLISRQLALALIFLQEKRIIHGKIRCHNIFIKSLDPIQIKITDPLGTFDSDIDRAFLPPEYSGRNGQLNSSEYDCGIDVWAVGTTLWQIYSGGLKPPPRRYANTLVQPSICPDQVWSVIERCWATDPCFRASPQSIFRDINDSLAWERDLHNYDYVSQIANYQTSSNDSTSTLTDQLSCKSRTSNSGSNGSVGSGSQMNLLSARNRSAVTNMIDFDGSSDDQTPDHQRTIPEHSGSSRRPSRSWISFMPFKNRSGTRYNEKNSEDRNGSRMSLSTCSTSSDSEKTRSTMLMDCQNVSDYSSNIDISRVKFGSEIGRGSCGTVIKGVLYDWGGLSEQVVAIKQVTKTELQDSSSVDDLKREAEILKKLNHKNIVKLLGVIDETSVSLVLEYMPLGSLLSFIKNSNHDFLLSMPLHKYALDIAKGMEYLENQRIVHRDLALRNVLLKDKDQVKICDFGLAQHLGTSGHYKLKTDRALPLRWYAPEVLSYWTFNHKTDVWSYGIVLWEIYSGGCNPQYSGTYADLTVALKHERLLKPRDCPELMYNLMLSCWAYNPDHRDSFAQIREKLENLPDVSAYTDGSVDTE